MVVVAADPAWMAEFRLARDKVQAGATDAVVWKNQSDAQKKSVADHLGGRERFSRRHERGGEREREGGEMRDEGREGRERERERKGKSQKGKGSARRGEQKKTHTTEEKISAQCLLVAHPNMRRSQIVAHANTPDLFVLERVRKENEDEESDKSVVQRRRYGIKTI